MKTAAASVIAVVRSTVHADELQKEYPFMKIIVVDLTDLESVRKAFHQLPNNSIDGLVNNAGIAIIKAFADFTEKDFDEYVSFYNFVIIISSNCGTNLQYI